MSSESPFPTQRVLSVNAGSSSLKLALFAMGGGKERLLIEGAVEEIAAAEGRLRLRPMNEKEQIEAGEFPTHVAALNDLLHRFADRGPQADATGHRVVHGGSEYQAPVRITPEILNRLRSLVHLAPLHLPANITAIEALSHHLPDLPQVACFDTAFHCRLPELAKRLPLPESFRDEGLRRYGFHGLSYEYVLAELPDARRGRTVIAHLGNGTSLAAIRNGVPVETTMGFTPTGGVMMGTRSGDLDPGVLIYLMRRHQCDADALERLVNHESGLRGVSGITSNMEVLLGRLDDPHCRVAVELYVYQIRKALGALAAVLGGLDTLVFTGGIGEHAAPVRAMICEGLEHLGVRVDFERNRRHDRCISASDANCRVLVVSTNEHLMIARHTLRTIHKHE